MLTPQVGGVGGREERCERALQLELGLELGASRRCAREPRSARGELLLVGVVFTGDWVD